MVFIAEARPPHPAGSAAPSLGEFRLGLFLRQAGRHTRNAGVPRRRRLTSNPARRRPAASGQVRHRPDAQAALIPPEDSFDQPAPGRAGDSLHAQGGSRRVSRMARGFFRRRRQIAQPLVIAVALEGRQFHRRQGLAGFEIIELGQALVVDESVDEAAAGAAEPIVNVAGATGDDTECRNAGRRSLG